ncbi:MAG: sporulation integral membrane protein YlbJ [Clostridia bacterium]|nr:sporulation integral membrane protein YlbJ [Clostridia bacterium]
MFHGEASYAFIMGIISGYPVGAKIVNKFIEDGTCSKQEAERMLAFTNNSGPLFIIGTVGISLFGDTHVGIILFITHILSCLTVGFIFGFISKHVSFNSKKRNYKDSTTSNMYSLSDLGSILSNSITNSISTILLIGGFIVLFSIIISILNSLNIIDILAGVLTKIGISSNIGTGLLTGLIELTNGVNCISCIHAKNMSWQIISAAFLLGFAGLSIFLQIFSIASKNNLSMKPYLIGKILQGCFAGIYTAIILNCFDSFYFNLC